MPMSTKAVTSKRVATIASGVLRSKKEDPSAKSAAGSALGQTPNRYPKSLIEAIRISSLQPLGGSIQQLARAKKRKPK